VPQKRQAGNEKRGAYQPSASLETESTKVPGFEDEAEQEAHEAWVEEQEHLASESAAAEAEAMNAENRPMTVGELREKVAEEQFTRYSPGVGCLGHGWKEIKWKDTSEAVRQKYYKGADKSLQTFLQFCDENGVKAATMLD